MPIFFTDVTLKLSRYLSQRSRVLLRVLRVKDGIRNFLAEPVVADVLFEAGNSGVKEDSVYSCSGINYSFRYLFFRLQAGSESRIRVNFMFAESIEVRCGSEKERILADLYTNSVKPSSI